MLPHSSAARPPNPLQQGTSSETTGTDSDAAVRQTDVDAAESRVSAVAKGYFVDPHISAFVRRARFVPPRPPLINIGTHARSETIDRLVNQWLDIGGSEVKKQVISLGAGSDTRFWRLMVSAALIAN